jgi:uncharacterized protein YjbJ (UPF0337 family)
VINNPGLEAEGEAEHREGKVREKVGGVRRKVREVVVKAGKAPGGK